MSRSKRAVQVRLAPEQHRRLKVLAAELDQPIQRLVVEAIGRVLATQAGGAIGSCETGDAQGVDGRRAVGLEEVAP